MNYELGKANRLGNRSSNQDRFAILERPGAVLLILADGMGGHEGGLLAATTLVSKFTETFRSAAFPLPDPGKFLHDTFVQGHHAVVEAGAEQNPPINPRTTGVACVVQGGRVWWAHVGDSRFYLMRSGNVVERTRDHSHVETLIAQGKISEKRAKTHPQRNQVTRCIGGNATKTPDVTLGGATPLVQQDVVMLCSDGLWGGLNDDVLAVELADHRPLATLVDMLAGLAEAKSYPKCDNVSVVALRWLDAVDHNTREAAVEAPKAPSISEPDPLGKPEVDAVIDEINRALQRADEGIKRRT